MDSANQPHPFMAFVPLLIMSIIFAPVAYLLAKEKGRNAVTWTVLALIPFVNFFCLYFFIGAANLKHEAKLDEILRRLNEKA